MRVAIVEDSPRDRTQLHNCLDRASTELKESFTVTEFEDGVAFLEAYGAGFDLVFLDIEMPHLDGMDTATELRKIDPDVILIFVTNMAQYALRGYDVGALDFILKPIAYYPFAMKLKRALRQIRRFSDEMLILKTPDGLVRISVSRIHYIEVRGHLLTYHTDDESYTVRETLGAVEKRLEGYHFSRCSNSYLINLKHFTALCGNQVFVGEISLPISRSRKVEFTSELAQYLGGSV